MDKKAPELLNERNNLLDTVADTATLLGVANEAALAFSEPGRLRRIEEGEQLAESAETNFKAALT